ncbi:MAG: tRNA pseudouridine(55) synthase TruB [Endomicrobium sp.]|jgi:tRNA pseudouridine55 synthase|nr:tRNA pseudouridine(55) synthase TruB [Endomicrobium sp.]
MIKNYSNISGLLLLDKPYGITSFDVVCEVKKNLNVKKVGHCGTLDPIATGLLIILIGNATKLQNYFMSKDKIYKSSFLIGVVTDSYDLYGNIISKNSIVNINIEKIKTIIKMFKGEIFQIPPMYSALKYKGKKLYELARQGIEIKRKPRKIIIKRFDIVSFCKPLVNVNILCSSGTYIRTIAYDLGNILGCGAIVKTLRREKIGIFNVNNALKIEDLNDINKITKNLIPYEKLIKML